LYLLGKKTAHFCALDFIHIKARARVESAPSFSRRVVVVSSRVLLPPPSPGRKRRATHRSERETESAVFADNTKKVKSNLSGKEKKPSRDISLSLSLFPVLRCIERRERRRAETFFIHLSRCCLPFVFGEVSVGAPGRERHSFRICSLGENWGLKKGGN